MDDLVKRLASWGTAAGLGTHFLGTKSAREDCAEAAATIARQQVMMDRALESNGDMQAEVARLRGLLAEASPWLDDGSPKSDIRLRIDAALEAKHG